MPKRGRQSLVFIVKGGQLPPFAPLNPPLGPLAFVESCPANDPGCQVLQVSLAFIPSPVFAARETCSKSSLKTAIDDFKHFSSKFYAVFVDFRDEFGSLSQSYMIRILLDSRIAKQYCEIVADIYMDSHFQVICHNELSKEFPLSVGAKTGCPLSALLFVVSLDEMLKEILEHAVRSLKHPR